jgi:hypothetical protein
MRNKRTVPAFAAIFVVGATIAGCGTEDANCAQVTGVYYAQFELLDQMQLGATPGDCTEVPFDRLDLTEDRTINSATSITAVDVWNGGCEFKVDYSRSVISGTDSSAEFVANNGNEKYRVDDGGVLRGLAVYERTDRDGAPSCIALFDATWMPEAIALRMMNASP